MSECFDKAYVIHEGEAWDQIFNSKQFSDEVDKYAFVNGRTLEHAEAAITALWESAGINAHDGYYQNFNGVVYRRID